MAPKGLSARQTKEIWHYWRIGESHCEIGRLLDIGSSSVWHIVRKNGGIVPRERKRRPGSLTLSDREEISRGIVAGLSFRKIALGMNRSSSTVSREVARNGGRVSYRAAEADSRALDRALRPKKCRLRQNERLRHIIAEKLSEDWSPQQVSGWLKRKYADDETMQVSHETIYRSLFLQARGVLKKELTRHLRSKRQLRRSKSAPSKRAVRGQIIDAVSIRERPAEAEDRAIPGHWEGDLIRGTNNTHIATLAERKSRFVMLVKVAGKDTKTVVMALSKQIKKLPEELRKTLTWDRGSEMASHKNFTVATNVKVYFCDPSSPWQRGTNENTNGLLRQYFPKGTDLSVHSQAHLNKIAAKLNRRPRQTLGFMCPAEKLDEDVALTD